jgi:hypothetical protein
MTNCLTNDGVIMFAKEFPGKKANRFIEWFTYSEETIEVGTVNPSSRISRATRL